MAYDDTLEEQVRTALAAKAEDVDRGPAWQGAEPRPMSRAASVIRRWQAPVLTAAAVIAVVTAAIVTHGFQGDRAAAPGGTVRAPVTVPIICSFTIAENAAGSANGAGSTAVASEQTGDCASPGTVELSVRGALPAAVIGWKLVIDGDTTGGSEARSDGTPLGFMTFPGVIEGHRYLWGAVGPDIAQVQLQAPQGDIDALDPGFTSTGSAMWTIDSGEGTAFSLPDPDTVVWTEIEPGWHAFALKLPDDTRLLDVTALRADGAVAQLVEYQVTEGSVMPISETIPTALPATTTLPATTAPAPTTTASGVETLTTDAASSTDTEPSGPDTETTDSATPDDSEELETRDPDVPASREKDCQLWDTAAFIRGPGELLVHHLAGKAVPMDGIRDMTLDYVAPKVPSDDDPKLARRIAQFNDEAYRLQQLPEDDWTWEDVDSLAAAYSHVGKLCAAK